MMLGKITRSAFRPPLFESRNPNPEAHAVTVCEYMRKLIGNLFNYFPGRFEKAFVANKRDIGFGGQNGPQIAPTLRDKI